MKKQIRDPEKTRAQILQVGFEEIYQHGFQGTSIHAIIEKTQLTKGAFFHHFATKNDLGYAIVDEVLRNLVVERWLDPLAAYQNPAQGVLKRLKKVIQGTEPHHFLCGCPLNNLTQEMSTVDPVFRDKLRAVMRLWIDGLEEYMKKAQARGYLKKNVPPREVAEFIVTLHEGAFGIVKSTGDTKIWNTIYHSLQIYLDSISIMPPRDVSGFLDKRVR